MADVIQLLPDAIANQIAAGEVIQRPASLVKELLENAIDAGGQNITLIVKDAGRTLVQVMDDGCGMSEKDARMAFARHATSKIRSAQDLFAIRTMGFRGEALASIAAVARVELRTRQHLASTGTYLVIEGSEEKLLEPCQTAPGTNLAVKNLFYNVPARRNFLKSDAVEFKHILTEFERIAIANPGIFFRLHHNNQEILHLPAANLRQRLINVFKSSLNQVLVPVKEETDIMRLEGFVGKPAYAKKNRGEQLFFVNGRFIKSAYLHHAVMTAYENVLPKESFPFYALFIELDPAEIDINVHPTKQEIKFSDERLVYNYLKVAVRHALAQHAVLPALDFEQEASFNLPSFKPTPTEEAATVTPTARPREQPRLDDSARQAHNRNNWEALYRNLEDNEPAPPPPPIIIGSSWSDEDGATAPTPPLSTELHQKAPYQLHQAYIVSQIKSGFLLIDQQAAHERVLYEKYLRQMNQSMAPSQKQLFPTTLILPPGDAGLLESLLPNLQTLGFDIQEFGLNSFVINGIPADLVGSGQNEKQLIETLLEQYQQGQSLQTGANEAVARALARSTAIRRGRYLSEIEMQALIDQLFACELPYRSPFGRKCFITYDWEVLDKEFNQ